MKYVTKPAALVALLAMAAAAVFAACGGDDDAPTPTDVLIQGEIVVYAAASLTDAYTEAGAAFQQEHPEARVVFNFAASSALAVQINEGAPADVFASADNAQMKNVTDAGNAAEPVPFATNVLVVAVPKSGSRVSTFADLAKPGVQVVLAGPEVPVGRYSRDILTAASLANGGISSDFSDRVLANLQSNEASVRAVLAKVQLGEADAGIVYSTDAATAPNDVNVVEIPAAYNVVAEYPTASLKDARNPAGAEAWVAFITGAEGQAILAKYGFDAP